MIGQTIATESIAEQALLGKIMPPYDVNSGLIIGAFLVIITFFVLKYTRPGYALSMCGINSEFAKYGGQNVNHIRIYVMLASGAIAGICGAVEVMGILGRFESQFSPDFGIEGILASLLGGNQPFGMLLGTLFMGMVKAGSLTVERSAGIPRALAEVIKAFIICFVSASMISHYLGIDWLQRKLKALFSRIKLCIFKPRERKEAGTK